MQIEARRAIISGAFSRAEKAGLPVETSPEFEAWLEQRVRGEIDMATLRSRYIEMLRLRDITWREGQRT